MKKKRFILDIILIPFILPVLILIIWTMTNRWIYPNIIPSQCSLRGFEYILNSDSINILLRSLGISIVVVSISIIISIPAAKAIALYEFKGKKIFELLVMSPIIVPMISIAMGIHIVFLRHGLANNIIGVIIINILPCIPYSIKMIADVYKLVGEKLELQAKVLGASPLNTFIYITFPLIFPGIMGAASMCFIISFSQYFLTMLIGGGTVITYPMIMFPYIQSGDRTISSIYSLVFLGISIGVLILVEGKTKKYYINNNSFLG